ncbi:MAG TPA: YbaN family protein [Blastocatellia bacterium]|nr:YbaN family protein [Blastocatellia bacterium]
MSLLAKALLNIAGTVFVALGILGAFLPLLPATPFLLLASACYIRGSDRLYRWLMGNRYLGPYIRNFQEKRGMPMKAKIISIAILWASLAFSIYRVEPVILDTTLIVVGVGVTTLILCIKTLKET